MARLSGLVASTLVVWAGVCSAAVAQTSAEAAKTPLMAALQTGRLDGVVMDETGAPLAGAAVTAQGGRLLFAVTDRDGRFSFEQVAPGPWLLRAHLAGFLASPRELVEVLPDVDTHRKFTLSRVGSAAATGGRPVMAAGVAQTGSASPPTATVEGDADNHDHTPVAWRLRHLKRPVLRSLDGDGVTDGGEEEVVPIGDTMIPGGVGVPVASMAQSMWTGLPVTGQVQLLTASTFDSPQQLFSSAIAPHQVAYVALGSPVGSRVRWSAHGAITQGDLSSWILGGTWGTGLADNHVVNVGYSFGTQRYDGGNMAALAAVSGGDRNLGVLRVFDTWTVSEPFELTFGGEYARYGYLEDTTLFSPSLAMRWTVGDEAWIRASVSQARRAPGAEEFVPSPVAGMWMPPQRTFAPLVASSGFITESSRELEVAIERQIASFIFSARGFRQDVDEQITTLFGVRVPDAPRTDLGHYYTTSAGDVAAFGWGVGVSRPLGSRVRGSMEYSIAHASWAGNAPDAEFLAVLAPSAVRTGTERVQDFTTTVETDIPETATRVFAVYRINTAYTGPSIDDESSKLAARFDVQLSQRLPFMQFTNADWEVLVAVCNFFRDQMDSASIFDELLVVRPPKRFVGGLMVRF